MEIVKTFDALGDASRIKILEIINKNRKISCMELLKKLKLSQPAVSHHLKILLDGKLIDVKRSGKYRIFSIDRKSVKEACRWLKKLV